MKSEYFMELNPLEKALKTHNIEGKRKMLKQILAQPKLTVKRRQEIERQLWVIAGVLDQNLSIKRLMKVNRTYERINLVPKGYNQAELFLQKNEPRHLEWLQERIN